ncbi:trifunctional histidinol dehydrogenase [Podochytrium sp. JEL0797]|nr:trifunctional histidinol dehydrogenase [Podochytrium sp. JEL0797]
MFLISAPTLALSEGLTLASPVLVPASCIDSSSVLPAGDLGGHGVWAEVCESGSVDTVVGLLNGGVRVAVVGAQLFVQCVAAGLPSDRLCVVVVSGDAVVPEGCVRVLRDVAACDAFEAKKAAVATTLRCTSPVSAEQLARLDAKGVDVVFTHNTNDLAALFVACCTTDRADKLIATCIADEHGVCLGLAFSDKESLRHALTHQEGAYHSRSRSELWVKGKTSNATQRLFRIDRDCDRDALRFVVRQEAPGFCHLNTRTCFGPDSGLTALEATLKSRKQNAPAGSYTARLFNDTALLHAKIKEEAQELCDAPNQDEIAWEAADLIYFALVKAVANGVSLADIESHLEKRAMKVTRRAGNAKPGDLEREQQAAAAKEAAKTVAVATAAPAAVAPPAATTVEPKLAIQMKVHTHSLLTPTEKLALLQRPIYNLAEISARVQPIVSAVQQRGDAAVKEFTAQFDRVELDTVVLHAPFPQSILDQVPVDVKDAIDLAFENIRKFHAAQLDTTDLVVETMPGVVCSRFSRPIERVGLYVPGGTAILPSTTMMLGIPAMVAKCPHIVVASPPRKDGTPVPEVAYVAHKIGAEVIVLAGGAQAVAAMAYGTETVPKVDKIVGPGNQYVTAAKMALQNDTKAMISIDMPAGPSELLVICDNSSNPKYIVSDLLSQSEHGTDSQVILVAINPTPAHLAALQHQLHTQGERLPRADIVRVSISKSYILVVQTREEAIAFSNQYAPEHLILHIEEPETVLPSIQHAGSVFVGPYSPESLGDYASGTNHTLPTYGYARMYSGVNTDTFVKYVTSQSVTREGLKGLGACVMRLAEVEGLEAHRNAVAVRLEDF